MTNPAKLNGFNFNEWSKLAINDPEAFEHKRKQVIEQTILAMSATTQQRIRSLQWRIDQERKFCKSSIAACIKLSNMMWEQVIGDTGLLQSIKSLENPYKHTVLPSKSNILFFPGSSM